MVRKRAELGVYVACALACVLGVAITASVACGSTTDDTSIDRDAGLPAVIETPPLACTATDGGCACEPSDAGVLDASASLCGTGVAPDAACCAGPDYPFAGACACGAAACTDGGARVGSCSSPPAVVDAGSCDPAQCSGSSCGGGYCCTSSCQNGACQSTCS